MDSSLSKSDGSRWVWWPVCAAFAEGLLELTPQPAVFLGEVLVGLSPILSTRSVDTAGDFGPAGDVFEGDVAAGVVELA